MDILVIGGHYSALHQDTLHHEDDFRLSADGILLNVPNLTAYVKNGLSFPPKTIDNRRLATSKQPYQQIYWSGIHLYDLLSKNGYEVELLNCHDTTDHFRLQLYKKKPACVIISMTFLNVQSAANIVADIREYLPDTWIAVGGNHTDYSYRVLTRQDDPLYQRPEVCNDYFFTMEQPIKGIDAYIVDTHGEETLLLAVDQVIRKGKFPQNLPNTIVKSPATGEPWQINPLQPEVYNINEFQINWSKVPYNYLSSVVPFQTTYGCPFKCKFCNFSLTKVHKKSIDILIAELRALAEHSYVQRVWFTDDNFFLTERKVIEFCERFIAEDFPFSWASFIRASSITPKSVEMLKKSGCSMLMLGLESGSQTILDSMGKDDTVSHYKQAASLLIEYGIDVEMSFIVGYPGETADTVDESIEFINSLPTNAEQISYLYLFKYNLVPMSPAFEKEERQRWQMDGYKGDWTHKTMRSDQVGGHLKRFAANTPNMVFNYLDPESKLARRDYVSLIRLRDDVARAKLSNGINSADYKQAWNILEEEVRRSLITK
ncbi:MAG: radical SAM protein [Magnetococcales bacterium]|nr:radical SAM protein [Magnetococcales bacterium]